MNNANQNPGTAPTNGIQSQAGMPQRYCRLVQTNDNYKFENLDEAVSINEWRSHLIVV
jgi:hypothetical protein